VQHRTIEHDSRAKQQQILEEKKRKLKTVELDGEDLGIIDLD
jgi:hypothetical protein